MPNPLPPLLLQDVKAPQKGVANQTPKPLKKVSPIRRQNPSKRCRPNFNVLVAKDFMPRSPAPTYFHTPLHFHFLFSAISSRVSVCRRGGCGRPPLLVFRLLFLIPMALRYFPCTIGFRINSSAPGGCWGCSHMVQRTVERLYLEGYTLTDNIYGLLLVRPPTLSPFLAYFPAGYGPQFRYSSWFARRRELSCSKVSWLYLSSIRSLVPRYLQSQLDYGQPPWFRERQFMCYRRRVSYTFFGY